MTTETAFYHPADFGEEDFLPGDALPDPFCRPTFADYIADIEPGWDADSLEIVEGHEGHYALAAVDDFNTRLLYRADTGTGWMVVGYYDGPTVCLHEDHQGKGLGAELILYTALKREAPPHEGWGQMWSKAGIAATRSAYRLAVRRRARQRRSAAVGQPEG